MTRFLPPVLLVSSLACSQEASSPSRAAPLPHAVEPASTSVPVREVRWFGSLHGIMHEGQLASAVDLTTLRTGHAWALGALEGLHGEVTVLDDAVWLARPNEGGTATVTRMPLSEVTPPLGAALLVVAHVPDWTEITVTRSVEFAKLEAFIESHLAEHGVPLDRPTAVRIEGAVTDLRWHVVDGSKLGAGASHADHARSAVRGSLASADAHLVGFVSRQHHGVFTHAGSNTHFHVVAQDGAFSGHVDSVGLAEGARVLLPRP